MMSAADVEQLYAGSESAGLDVAAGMGSDAGKIWRRAAGWLVAVVLLGAGVVRGSLPLSRDAGTSYIQGMASVCCGICCGLTQLTGLVDLPFEQGGEGGRRFDPAHTHNPVLPHRIFSIAHS